MKSAVRPVTLGAHLSAAPAYLDFSVGKDILNIMVKEADEKHEDKTFSSFIELFSVEKEEDAGDELELVSARDVWGPELEACLRLRPGYGVQYAKSLSPQSTSTLATSSARDPRPLLVS